MADTMDAGSNGFAANKSKVSAAVPATPPLPPWILRLTMVRTVLDAGR